MRQAEQEDIVNIDNSPEMQRFAAAMAPARWHVGSNIVGYMPEGDVYCIEGSEQYARDAAREEALRALDCDGACCRDHENCDAEDCSKHTTEPDNSGNYYLDSDDCGYLGPLALHVWYAPCDTPAECAAEDDN